MSPRFIVLGTVRELGFRLCRSTPLVRHTFDYPACDCLRRELPPEHRALSSGRLGTPERNRRCPDCSGLGRVTRDGCPRCLGTGELTAAGGLVIRENPAISRAHRQIKKPRVSERKTPKTPSKLRASGTSPAIPDSSAASGRGRK